MSRLSLWLDELGTASQDAAAAEQAYRDDFARRVAALAEARAVAFRRANLVRAIADAVAGAEDEEMAVAHGLAVLRTRLGWSSDSEARAEILSRFAPVCAAAFGGLGEDSCLASPLHHASHGPPPPAGEETKDADPAAALAAFEAWYLGAKGTTFWVLFENVMPETPLVDF